VTIAIRNKKTAALGGHADWKYQVKEIQFKKKYKIKIKARLKIWASRFPRPWKLSK
jgi:hypothetical protein